MSQIVPDALRHLDAFILWRLEANPRPDKKPLKVPVHHDGLTRHSKGNPAPMLTADLAEQWCAYLRQAGIGHGRAGEPGYLGVGFRPGPQNGVVVIDLDDQLDNPAILPWFSGAGIEVSHSGKGLHIWCTSRNAAAIGRRGRANTAVGALEVYADRQFIALGTWLGGNPMTDCTDVVDLMLAMYFPEKREREGVTAADWPHKTPQQKADTLVDLRDAIKHYDPDNRDEWIAAGQALKCLGGKGYAIWAEWSATSTKFPGGDELDRWDGFSGERSDYRAVFARAQSRGWTNGRRVQMAEEAFRASIAQSIGHRPTTNSAKDALDAAVATVRADPGALVEVAYPVARMAAGGQIPWAEVREALHLAAPDVDVAVIEQVAERAKLVPLAATAQVAVAAEQVVERSQVGWLREQGLTTVDAVLNERALAFRVHESRPGKLRFIHSSSSWIRWDDGRWVPMEHQQMRDICMHEVPVMLAREMTSLGGQHAAEYAKCMVKAATVATAGNIANIVAYLPGVMIKAAEIDANPMVVGMNGGRQVLDLATGRVRAAEIGDYVTRNLGVSAVGDAKLAVRWRQFLREVFQDDTELINWMQRFCGYMLTGSTKEQVFLFLFGSGSNGKSVFSDTLRTLMGDYCTTLQAASLCDDKRNGGGASPDLASLNSRRLVLAPEAEEGSRFAESMLKQLVGGDTMKVRDVYEKPFDMTPALKLVLTGNHKPAIKGTDNGVWRRVRLVPFTASFLGREDRSLASTLLAELPHILAWCIEGCIQWQQVGLGTTPASVIKATDEYRDEQDIIGEWLADRCEPGPHYDMRYREPVSALYQSFSQWCEAGGIKHFWIARVFSVKLNEYRRGGWNIISGREASARLKCGVHLKIRPAL